MKDQYFGDVNDYLKYGLLRCCAEVGWKVGVCWMLTPNEGRSDGRKIRYLSDPNGWRDHDPTLFDKLQATVKSGERKVTVASTQEFVPRACFFEDPVPASRGARSEWLERAFRSLLEADLLFFDPDNGLEVPSRPRGRRDSVKYVFWDEVEPSWKRGASLLIFQHFAREDHEKHVTRLVLEMEARAPGSAVTALITSNVFFLLASQPQHAIRTDTALKLLKGRWGTRFKFEV